MQPLSIGIQTFKRLRENDCLYVDKTSFAHQIMERGGSFFLSRPRRFGKSLFLSTLMELAEGNRALFENTWIEDKWDWTRKYPVLHFRFAEMPYQRQGLEKAILLALQDYCKIYEFETDSDDIKLVFKGLIQHLYKKNGKVVLLFDEYDKPILNYIEDSEVANAIENQAIMKMFYSVLKDAEPYLHLTFITGIAKFAKVSIFSDINHLDDLTFDPRFAAAYGYTQTELETNFTPYLQHFLKNNTDYTQENLLQELKEWYNGYSWDGETSVYNPFGLLHFFKYQRFINSWFESGTPTFLVQSVLREQTFDIENLSINLSDTNLHALDLLDNIVLLLQTGYLTIQKLDRYNNAVLSYPNREVRESFYRFLLRGLGKNHVKNIPPIFHLSDAFRNNDLYAAQKILKNVFSDLPYDIYTNQSLEQVEGFYHGIIHILFQYLGIYIQSEVHTTEGRMDSVVFTDTHIFIFEFKINQTAALALQQIQTKNYASKYENQHKKLVLIGANFNTQSRLMDDWAFVLD
jgi:Predicted AAA-ATPase/PD-(D/E)XK nuclease superfamily